MIPAEKEFFRVQLRYYRINGNANNNENFICFHNNQWPLNRTSLNVLENTHEVS